MIPIGLRAVVLPHPPLLAAELTGPGALAAATLREACTSAVAELLAGAGDGLVMIGAGEETRRHPDGAWGTLGGYGVAVDAPAVLAAAPGAGAAGLPLSLTVGALLVDRSVPAATPHEVRPVEVVEVVEVAATEDADACRRLGADLATRRPDAAWLVLGDGTTRRTLRAPGAFDPRAEPFDASVEAALASGDPRAVLALDVALAAALGAAGRSAWQVLAGAWEVLADGRPASARIDYADAPFGVGYLVARWSGPA